MHKIMVAGAASLALAAGTLVGPANAASPSAPSGHWLAQQQSKGLVSTTSSFGTFVDYGLTIDIGAELKVLGGHKRVVKKIRRAIARHVDDYTTGAASGTSDIYAGATAKALAFAQLVGAKGRDFGGVNLVRQLNHRVMTTAPNVGRISDKSAYGDYANTIGQAYAAAALRKAHSRQAAPAVRFLLKQQCRKGYFRLDFAPVTASRQACDAGSRASSVPDTDVTALAVIELNTIAKPTAKERRAINRAVRWLKRHQKANGSFGGGSSTEASNANSTGLAAQALGEAGRCTVATKAARWVKKLRRANGAIAYDKAAKKAGINKATRDQWRRATSQAAVSLDYLNGCPHR